MNPLPIIIPGRPSTRRIPPVLSEGDLDRCRLVLADVLCEECQLHNWDCTLLAEHAHLTYQGARRFLRAERLPNFYSLLSLDRGLSRPAGWLEAQIQLRAAAR